MGTPTAAKYFSLGLVAMCIIAATKIHYPPSGPTRRSLKFTIGWEGAIRTQDVGRHLKLLLKRVEANAEDLTDDICAALKFAKDEYPAKDLSTEQTQILGTCEMYLA